MIYTEHEFTTPALEKRRVVLSCIVKYLTTNGVTDDEFFSVVEDSRNAPTEKCSTLIAVERQSFQSDFNTTLNACFMKNVSKTDDHHLTKLQHCQTCIRQKLDETNDYELKRLHIAAVNQTIVHFKIWQYFTMAPKIQQLLDESRELEMDAFKDCKKDKLCDKKIKSCIL